MTTYRCPSISALRRTAIPAMLGALAVTAAATTICLLPSQARAADDAGMQRLATCQDAWSDWQEGDPRMKQYQTFIASKLTEADGGAFTPNGPMTAFGLPITQVSPQSVGMGVGFSLLVAGDLAQVRKQIEKQLGRSMTCAVSDGAPACELKIASKKTVVLMTDSPKSRTTLAGCYYFYQQ
jgi:hypothetical protein